MYARPSDRVDDEQAALEMLEAAPLVHLVSSTTEVGFEVTSLPMIVDHEAGHLAGHVARANTQWERLDGSRAVVIAVTSESYVSPSWYPSKQQNDGRVVPTWNYEAVHVHGVARVHADKAWLSDLVRTLTDRHETRRTDGSHRWAVSDAPIDFIDRQLDAIVGVSVSLERIEAKQKLNANRSAADRAGVVEGLSATDGAPQRMIELMARSLDGEPR
ncbi:MAG: FMN-binding negative transcriptional regulator [Actinomycetota bacterium]